MNKERRENLEKRIVEVEVILMHALDLESEELLNKIVFFFNAQVPGAIHGTTEVKTIDKSYRLIVSVEEEHLKEFKKYIKETDPNIICLLAFDQK